VMKSLMDLLGMAGGPVRPPLANLRPEEVESLRAGLPAWTAVV
jgi:dihydrodipicolinate synthase/N-acetylneuraminate lyase